MKRSSSPENDDDPAQKRLTKKRVGQLRQVQEEWKQFHKQVDTSGTVIWSGTVKIPDSQKIVFDCSIKAHPQDEGIKSLFPPKQLTMRILPLSVVKSLHPYKIQLRGLILCTDENTDMMSYSAFYQAIRLGSDMMALGFTVLKNSASTLHLLIVYSFSNEHEDYIVGVIETCQVNDTVLGILRSHGLLPCGNPGHKELAKENTTLKEELQLKDKKLTQQQSLIQELLKRHAEEMKDKERKHEEERNMMGEQLVDKEKTITNLDKKIKNVLLEKKEIVTNMYLEFQCSICQDTIIEACSLSSCGHMFCKFCIGQWLKEKTKCPLCKLEAGIPVPCIAFDRAVDNFIGHLGNEAKQQRIKAVKDREAAVEIIHVRSLLVSSEESEGQSATSEGESMTSDGESMISEEESVTSERESMTSEGESMISEEESVTSERESVTSEGESMISEEEMVPEHSCSVTELEASFVGPRESSANRSSEESLIEAAEGEQSHREPEEMQTPSFFSTLPPFLPLSSPSSSEDEPSLS